MYSRAEGSVPRRPDAAPFVLLAGAARTRIVPPDFGDCATIHLVSGLFSACTGRHSSSAHRHAAGVSATIPTVARDRNRAGGPHARVRLRLQRLS